MTSGAVTATEQRLLELAAALELGTPKVTRGTGATAPALLLDWQVEVRG
ncbi:MAG: hypothetical protein U1E76_08615 [Planctomycetota bacterium]